MSSFAASAAGLLRTAFLTARTTPLPDPCNLLTLREAAIFLGQAVLMDSSKADAGGCTFKGVATPSSLSLTGYVFPDPDSATKNFRQLGMVPGRPTQAVSSIGDQAAFLFTAAGDASFILRNQEKLLLISIVNAAANPASHKLTLLQAGKAAASRL